MLVYVQESGARLREGAAHAAMETLSSAIHICQTQLPKRQRQGSTPRSTTKSTATAKRPPFVVLAEQLAAMYAVVANEEAIQSSEAAAPMEEVQKNLQEAMRYLVRPDEIIFPEATGASHAPTSVGSPSTRKTSRTTRSTLGGSPRATRNSSPRLSRAPSPVLPLCFPPGPPRTIYRAVRAMVRCNAAVCLGDRATREGLAAIIYQLLKALDEAQGVWCCTVLYNIAVCFLAYGRFDDASEAIARQMELSMSYLEAAEAVSRKLDSATPTFDEDSSNPMEEADVPLADVVASVMASMAAQRILGHHFIASLAAWCRDTTPTEVCHCEMAVSCAEKYLDEADSLHTRCAQRLAGAVGRASSPHRTLPPVATSSYPQLPFAVQSLHTLPLRRCQPATPSTAALDMNDAGSWAALSTVRLPIHMVLSVCSPGGKKAAMELPAEVRAFVKAIRTGNWLSFWAQEAHLSSVDQSNLPQLLRPKSLNTILEEELADRSRRGTRSTSPRRSQMGSISPRRSQLSRPTSRSSRFAKNRDEALTPRKPLEVEVPPSPAPPSVASCSAGKPSPFFITSLPQSTFNRYQHLKQRIITNLAKEEEEAQTAAAATAAEKSGQLGRLPSITGARTSVGTGEHPELLTSLSEAVERPDSGQSVGTPQKRLSIYFARSNNTPAPLNNIFSPAPSVPQSPEVSPTAMVSTPTETVTASEMWLTNQPGTKDGIAVVALPPSQFMISMDTELEQRYSRLVGNPLADIQRAAALRLQCYWRGYKARELRRQREAAVVQAIVRWDMACRIQKVYRDWCACRPAVAELARLLLERQRLERVVLLQRFVLQQRSIEVWGVRCQELHQRLLAEKHLRELRAAASTTLQSWTRMLLAQKALRRDVAAASCLQRAWRCYRARWERLCRRVRRWLDHEEWVRARRSQAIYIQRWWLACQARRAVVGLLPQKQRNVEEYLLREAAVFDAALSQYRDPGAVYPAVQHVLAVFRGAHVRAKMRKQHYYLGVLHRAIHLWVLRWKGSRQLQQLRLERSKYLALQRRREEVQVACLRIQNLARRWLAKHCRGKQLHHQTPEDKAACRIQRAYRASCARRNYQTKSKERAKAAKLQRDSQLLEYSAAKIQATWRMHRTRTELLPFFQFMLVDRHRYATLLQSAWRGYHARSTLVPLRREDVEWREGGYQQDALERCAAVRIQSFYRMAWTRAQLRAEGYQLAPTPMQLNAAAKRIQKHWRALVAYRTVYYMRMTRLYADNQRQAQESLHAFATAIQAVVRSFLVRRRLGPRSVRPTAASITTTVISSVPISTTATPIAPTITITTPRPTASTPKSSKKTTTTVNTMANAAVVSPLFLMASDSVDESSAGTKPSSSIDSVTVTASLPSTSYANRLRPLLAEAPGPLRSSPQLSEDQTETSAAAPLKEEEEEASSVPIAKQAAAALVIQRVWRGFVERSSIEYYYEEYYETESASAEEEGDEDE